MTAPLTRREVEEIEKRHRSELAFVSEEVLATTAIMRLIADWKAHREALEKIVAVDFTAYNAASAMWELADAALSDVPAGGKGK